MTSKFFFHSSLLLLFLDPGSGMGKNQDPGSGINNPTRNTGFDICRYRTTVTMVQYIKFFNTALDRIQNDLSG
jgi:hypothetical protein